jgi:hypothetical protein
MPIINLHEQYSTIMSITVLSIYKFVDQENLAKNKGLTILWHNLGWSIARWRSYLRLPDPHQLGPDAAQVLRSAQQAAEQMVGTFPYLSPTPLAIQLPDSEQLGSAPAQVLRSTQQATEQMNSFKNTLRGGHSLQPVTYSTTMVVTYDCWTWSTYVCCSVVNKKLQYLFDDLLIVQ